MLPSREQLMEKADALPQAPVAFEAFWDGDSGGWYVVLTAILKGESGFRDHCLWAMQEGGDLRLFNGQAPPWGEARLAQQVGEGLAAKFGVPFYFPSPNHPEDDCPRWWEQAQGSPCRRCGIPLLQRHDPCPWRGVCYYCYLEEEREKKEAAWTPEERAAPRCHICGNPATGTLSSSPTCQGCLDRYEVYQCSQCGLSTLILKSARSSDLCSRCVLRARLDAVPESHRQAIRHAAAEGGKFAGIRKAKELLDWSLRDAMDAVQELRDCAAPHEGE
jgi:hypothetical protein